MKTIEPPAPIAEGPPEGRAAVLARGARERIQRRRLAQLGEDIDAQELRQTSSFRGEDMVELFTSFVAAVSLSWLVFYRLTPMRGALGFVVASYGLFLLIYWRVAAERHDKLAGRDKLMSTIVASAALVVVAALVSVVVLVTSKGLPSLGFGFFTHDMHGVDPTQPATDGGGLHAIIGTLQQSLIALAISAPMAVLTAVYLNEVGGRSRFARVTRFVIDSMSGLPSIIAGLFVFSAFILRGPRLGGSGILGSLALAILMVPTITRTTEEMLRLIPSGLREAALALGAPRWRVTLNVVLPTARAGLVTAVILGLARAVGETAPVLLTTFGAGVARTNANPFSDPQSSLPLFVFQNITLPNDNLIARAWTGALTLLALVLTLFTIARLFSGRKRT